MCPQKTLLNWGGGGDQIENDVLLFTSRVFFNTFSDFNYTRNVNNITSLRGQVIVKNFET